MKKSQSFKICPHLIEEQVLYCGISGAGIYIPMPSHLRLFCFSEGYRTCRQLEKSAEYILQSQQRATVQPGATRRSFHRIKQRLPLFVDHSMAAHPSPEKIARNLAYTIDMSLGGLQVSMAQELEPEDNVTFVFDGAFSKPFWVGMGKVKWCRENDHNDRFLAGLAFTDIGDNKVIAHHLNEFVS